MEESDDLPHLFAAEGIIDRPAIATRMDKPVKAQASQMLRDIGLGKQHQLFKLADRFLSPSTRRQRIIRRV